MRRPWATFTDEQRRAAFLVDRSVVSAAAAGSGKTQVLAVRYCACLLRDGEPLGPDRILAITFTREAAANLRARIASVLGDILAAPEPAFPDYLRAGGEDVALTESERAHLQRALLGLPHAPIGTVDAFCAELVAEHADRAARDPALQPPPEGPEWMACQEQAWQVLRRQAAAAGGGALGLLIGAYGERALRRRIAALAEQALALPQEDLVAPPADAAARLAERRQPQLEALAQLVEDLRGCGPSPAAAAILALVPAPLPRGGEALRAAIRALDGLEARAKAGKEIVQAIQDCLAYPAQRRGGTRPAEGSRLGCASLLAWAAADPEQTAVLHQRAVAGSQVVRDYQAALLEAAAQAGIAPFARTARTALALLGEPGVARTLTQRLRHLLLDEAQDLSRLQGALVDTLAATTPPPRVFTVGDHRQSIYGFRHAEPALFQRWEAAVEPTGARAPLGKNFRSEPVLVEAVRRIFAGELTAAFRPHEIASGQEPRHADATLGCWRVTGDDPEAAEALQIARLVADSVVAGRPPGDHAIIMRTRRRMRLYADQLERAGLPVDTDFPGGLFEAQECWDLEAVLRLCCCPHDRFALACALAGPWGVEDPQDRRLLVEALEAPGTTGAALVLARTPLGTLVPRVTRVLAQEGVAAAVRLLVHDGALSRRYAGLPLARKRLANALALAQEAQEAGVDAVGLVTRWRQRRALGADGAEADGQGLGTRGVRLLTIHGAKGLEWPVVILPEMGERLVDRDTGCLVGLASAEGLALAAAADRDGGPALAYALAREDLGQLRRAEDARLFYVAATRAVAQLHLIRSDDPQGRPGPCMAEWVDAAGFAWQDVTPRAPQPVVIGQAVPHRDPLPALAPAPPVPPAQVRALTALVDAFPEPGRAAGAVPTLPAGDAARRLGVAVHRLLARGAIPDAAAIARVLAPFAGDLEPMVLEAIGTTLAHGLTPLLAQAQRVLREQPFVAEVAPGDPTRLVVATPDLVLAQPDGRWQVVDFKTGATAGSTHDQRQVRWYAAVVARHLGAPVARAAILDLRQGALLEVALSGDPWEELATAWQRLG